jgi:hypothetical protein
MWLSARPLVARGLDFAQEHLAMAPSLERKLAVLADAAKSDAACASSGSVRRKARAGGIASTESPTPATQGLAFSSEQTEARP